MIFVKLRRLNQKEITTIEQVLAPYGMRNHTLQGGAVEEKEDGEIYYHLTIENFNPFANNANKLAKKIMEELGVDTIFIQAVQF